MPTYLKYMYIFLHFELRSDPDPDFFLLSRIRIQGEKLLDPHPCKSLGARQVRKDAAEFLLEIIYQTSSANFLQHSLPGTQFIPSSGRVQRIFTRVFFMIFMI